VYDKEKSILNAVAILFVACFGVDLPYTVCCHTEALF